MEFERILEEAKKRKDSVIAVAAAEDETVLKAVCKAQETGIVKAVLCGRKQELGSIAEKANLDISGCEIINTEDSLDAAKAAVKLVHDGYAGMLMKGLVQTADLLRAVLDREGGLRTDNKDMLLSHVSVIESPILKRVLLLTDGAMVPAPGLKEKVSITENAVIAAKGLGIKGPKVAPLAAVEVVNPNMQATLDAAALTVMNQRGQIRGCVIDGPLAMDLAISEDAVRHKKIDSPVAGKADILLFHNIEAANSVVKTFTNAGDSVFAGVIMGASAPVVLTSRSDSDQSKLYSIACAVLISDNKN